MASHVPALPGGTEKLTFVVPAMHCAGCLAKAERTARHVPGIVAARANLSAKTLTVEGQKPAAKALQSALEDVGLPATPLEQDDMGEAQKKASRHLMLCLAVAGFGMMNVMLLSVSVWAGLVTDMDSATRALFHWISAFIALPTIAFAGQPFFRSAYQAVTKRQLNMDVPISVGLLLTTAASLIVAVRGGTHAYFDAALMLLFFLLTGRVLDQMMRTRTASAAQSLLKSQVRDATRILSDGTFRTIDLNDIEPGMRLAIKPGERVPVDCLILHGQSDVDMSMVTGESMPCPVGPNAALLSGVLNVSGGLTVKATARAKESYLAELATMIEIAEQAKGRLVSLADKVARAYAPIVHILAFLAFVLWLTLGAGWFNALMISVAVLIITCPCALGLAVPAVQVKAVGGLLKHGIIVKSGDSLSRLAEVDTIVFDKTGTLTRGTPHLASKPNISEEDLRFALAMAAVSNHPLSKGLRSTYPDFKPVDFETLTEQPGDGIEAVRGGTVYKLGRRSWVDPGSMTQEALGSELVYRCNDGPLSVFRFHDRLREDAVETVAMLKNAGFDCILLSGDQSESVAYAADVLGIDDYYADKRPADKLAILNALKQRGKTVAMVGDGLNDAPALTAAHVSLSPAAAVDTARNASDIVYQSEALSPVRVAIETAQRARALVHQNFALALGYNILAVPLAFIGLVTPLIAAIAMSASSLLVTFNAARLKSGSCLPKGQYS